MTVALAALAALVVGVALGFVIRRFMGQRAVSSAEVKARKLVTDAERLRIALVNILSNARHAVEAANGAGGGPGVRLTTRRRGDRVVLTVRDCGTGIAPENLAHIFDPYFTTRRTGTGLGLPISKNIVEGLGGALSVSSRPGEGTEIRIELPLAAVSYTHLRAHET